ncbi:MAG: TetR/AcrR family transcriptional regulator, partial [Paracoccaceae bacterium]|nr:TetR/AcrR family transcriptional regulator [Paracoccaceae bacterium]
FWAQGYEAASVDQLSRGMGVPRASLYNLFGDKERLFLSTVRAYAEGPFAEVVARLDGHGALPDDLKAFFAALIALTATEGAPQGCMVSCALADAAGTHEGFREELSRRLAEVDRAIDARLVRALAEGDLPAGTQTEPLARVIGAVARGLTVSARSGAPKADLAATAAACVALLPGGRVGEGAGRA